MSASVPHASPLGRFSKVDATILARKRHELHNHTLELLEAHATGDAAERVREAELLLQVGGPDREALEGYLIATEIAALTELVVTQQLTPKKSKAKV